MVWMIVFLFLAASAAEISVLVKRKYIRDIPVFLILMAIALTYGISGVTDWNFYSPSALVEMVFKPLSELVFPSPGG